MEEKFKKAMVANAGLDNEKSALNYQVISVKEYLSICDVPNKINRTRLFNLINIDKLRWSY